MERLYALGLRALPAWLRREAGADMLDAFRAGRREAVQAGPLALLAFWAREAAGLAATVVRSRRPDRWTTRTAPRHASARHATDTTHGIGTTMDLLRSDLRFAVRGLMRRPGVTLLTALTLSLGIGASTAMFSVVQSVLLKPLPYPEVDRLVSVYPARPSMRGHPTLGRLAERGTWSWPEFFGVEQNQQVFDILAAYETSSWTLTGEGPAEQLVGARVTWTLFPLLGATPYLGRGFNEDDEPNSAVVVLSHGTWRDRFGGDPAALGRTVVLGEEAHQIVGVLPTDFELGGARNVAFWFPMSGSFTDPGLENHGGTRAVARLAEGVSVDRARAELTTVFQSILPPEHGVHEGSVFLRQADETETTRPVILVMLAASVLLLLVACGNAAAFLLGSGIERERELAVRGAIGASRARIATQLLAESSLLALLSIFGGVVAAAALTKLMLLIAPSAVPGLDRASIDLVVLGFAALAAVVFGVGFGMIPALSLSSVDIAGAMGSGRSTASRRARLQSAVVVGEIALASVLAVSGLLLVRTVGALDGIDPGFDHRELAAIAVATPYHRFRDAAGNIDEEALGAYHRRLRDEVAAIPGVEAVTMTSNPPLTDWRGNNTVTPEGWDPGRPQPFAERRFVTPGFFEIAGIDITDGRGFTPEDMVDGAPRVVVISEGLADLGWPGGNAVGRLLNYWGRQATVVGVARNIRDEELEEVTELAFYAPGSDGPLLVRADADPASLLPAIRERLSAFDRDVPVLLASSLAELVVESTAEERYRARLIAMFAGLAGFLSLLGIYGVTSRSVARRTREIGIRVALGAKRDAVWRMVSIQAALLGLFGAAAGVLGSLAAAPFLQSFLWGVSAADPLTLASVLIALPCLALLAALVPARRATRIDPLDALRAE